MSKLEHFSTPEDVLVLHPELPPGIMIDAIECALQRAESVLSLLSPYFDGQVKETMPAGFIIANAIWSISGELENIRKLAAHAYQTECELNHGALKQVAGA